MTIAEPGCDNLRMPSVPTESMLAAAPIVKIHSIDPLSDPAWDRLAGSHPEFTFFHSSAWARVLSATYGHTPQYYSFINETKLTALLPMMEVRSLITGRRGVCLPFTDSCGPLYFGKNPPSQLVLDHLMKTSQQRNWRYFEMRQNEGCLPGARPAVTFHNHLLELKSGGEDQLHRFAGPVRRAIRKAGRNGLKARTSTDCAAILEFYGLHVQTRKRHGLPPQPVSFFQNIHEHVLKAGLGFVVMVHLKERPVAGAVFFHANNKAIYKFGASDASLNELRGNNLAMWKGIETLSELGVTTLDFGRTSLANDGLRRFKSSWAADERTIEYIKFDTNMNNWAQAQDNSSGIHTRFFRHLPNRLNRVAGALLYPHLD